jgi:DNA-binding CsgD family transcriptional regulator
MALNRRWIKLGRLFMVAWLSFFIYPVAALVTARFDPQTRIAGLALLLILALIWGWFWLRVVDPGLAAAALSSGISPLSEREREVLVAGRNGAGIAEIAKALFLSEGTVRNYLSSAIQKLEVSNRTEAARVAEDQGWL